MLEVSPISAMVPAMGLLGCGAKVDPGKPWWDNVAAGRYYARLGHARRVCPPARYYSWEVSPVLAHSGDAQDPLAVLAVTHETPSGSTVSFAEVSPRPSAMLLARLGFEPKPTHEHEYVKRRQSAWRLARAKREDSRPLRELFRAAFGHDMPAELWEWKYGAERGGFGVAVWRGAQAVAYYGAMPRWLRFFAQPVEVIQICDVMTHPAERGVLTRSGPFVCAALTFAECCVGTAAPYPFAFGFPSARHERLGTKLGIYHAASRIVEVSWPCRRSPRSPWWSTRVLGWNARDALAAEQLWHEMAQSLAQFVVADRPASYLRSRFLEHPVLTYTLLLVRHRWTMQPRGIAVLRDHGAWMELVDLVSAVDHMAMTVDAARRFVGNSGRTELRGWITEEFVSAVRSDDASVAVTEITVPLLGTPAMPAAALAGRSRGLWFLMAGDTDFH